MKNSCNIIRDILPLYVEDMVSQDTREFVEEHLAQCAACRAERERLQSPAAAVPIEAVPMEHLKKKLRHQRMLMVVFTAALVLAIAVSVFAVLTTPQYLAYTEDLIHITQNENGTLTVTFDKNVSQYNCMSLRDPDTAGDTYLIEAWNTGALLGAAGSGSKNLVIAPPPAGVTIYYTQNDGTMLRKIYDSSTQGEQNSAGTALPRLILTHYFSLALIALPLLLVARFLIRGNETAKKWLDKIWPLPACYMAAHLCTKGCGFSSYSAERDLFFILMVAVLLYCTAMSGSSLYKIEKERRTAKKTGTNR